MVLNSMFRYSIKTPVYYKGTIAVEKKGLDDACLETFPPLSDATPEEVDSGNRKWG